MMGGINATLESNPVMRATATFACAFFYYARFFIMLHFWGNFDIMKVICNYRLCQTIFLYFEVKFIRSELLAKVADYSLTR